MSFDFIFVILSNLFSKFCHILIEIAITKTLNFLIKSSCKNAFK